MTHKPQMMACNLCGYRWVGTNATCQNPNCGGIAKSEGEMTRKTFQDDSDLKKGLR